MASDCSSSNELGLVACSFNSSCSFSPASGRCVVSTLSLAYLMLATSSAKLLKSFISVSISFCAFLTLSLFTPPIAPPNIAPAS